MSAIIFDLDGTIWDSTPCFAQVLSSETGIPAAQLSEELKSKSIVALIERAKISRTRFVEHVRSLKILQPYPGVQSTLSQLGNRATPLGVFTSLPGKLAEPLLAELELTRYFGAIFHAGNCPSRKPHPRGIRQALRSWACRRPELYFMLVIETSIPSRQKTHRYPSLGRRMVTNRMSPVMFQYE